MDSSHSTFASLEAATAVLHRIREPLIIIRFAPDPAEWMVVAVNDAAAAISTMPAVGDHPDSRRDRDVTPDLELEYLYHQLVERGHARQLLSLDGGHLYELAVSRIMVAGDDAVYGYVSGTLRADHFPT
jgi:hypothetical protein